VNSKRRLDFGPADIRALRKAWVAHSRPSSSMAATSPSKRSCARLTGRPKDRGIARGSSLHCKCLRSKMDRHVKSAPARSMCDLAAEKRESVAWIGEQSAIAGGSPFGPGWIGDVYAKPSRNGLGRSRVSARKRVRSRGLRRKGRGTVLRCARGRTGLERGGRARRSGAPNVESGSPRAQWGNDEARSATRRELSSLRNGYCRLQAPVGRAT
jgi:hypothetical protein